MTTVRAEIEGIMAPTLFPSLDHALPVLWEHVRELAVREAHRDFIRICIGPGGGEGVARCLSRGGSWSTTLHVGELTDWTAHPITITTHGP
ncbi:hypothetical protein [Streptomyces sp. CB01881]|uniref:hypothetical protein n=1 Tax=Streptomyces sp. CB01881 TaxID=2078691 RepID=UPI000CDBCC8C|nr:hypothetical protein [Streptomyces sp. CB01881]AUY49892.1 hypothetical protein C2142_14275 [Streptomyces sp. CB01881]TYC73289.1 hypothetical protein EH183_14260 [Streptomyces sp. CB01881]